MKKLIAVSVIYVIFTMSICTLLIVNELQQIRQAIVDSPSQAICIDK